MFYRFRIPIIMFSRLLGLLPKFILRWLYRLFQPWPGLFPVLIRYGVARNLCASLGDNVYIGNNVTIQFFERLRIGSNVSIHTQCYIDANGGIDIGDDVSIAHASSLVSFDHSWDDPTLPIRKNPLITAPIQIASDVWIGAGVRILAGSRVPGRSVVAAGAVVTRKLESTPDSLIAGTPARTVRSLTHSICEPEHNAATA
ncbi:MAG: acyltransferase [Pseudomonadota bacterium]